MAHNSSNSQPSAAALPENEKPNTASGFTCGDFVVRMSSNIQSFAETWPTLSELEGASDVRSFAFQCRDHLEVWLATIGSACHVRPFFIGVSDKRGNPLMMIPLGVEKRAGIRILGFLDGGVSDYNAPVVYRSATKLGNADVRRLWKLVCSVAPPFDVALLQKMPEFVADFENPLFGLASAQFEMSGHYLKLGTKVDDDAHQRERDVRDSKRKRKRISEIGGLKFSIARDESEIQTVFDTFVRQKSRRYMETIGTPGFDVPGQRSYYLTATQRLSGRGAQLSYLSVGNDILATAWSLVAGRRFYYLMCAYDDGSWRKFSPGRLLMEELIEWSYRNGIEVFDLGIGDEPYKLKWRQTTFALASGMFPRTIIGRIYCAAKSLRTVAKRRLPPELIRMIKALTRRDTSRA